MEGKLQILIRNILTGEIEGVWVVKNIVLNNIRSKITHLLGGSTSGYINRIKLGQGDAVPSATDSDLENATSTAFVTITGVSYASATPPQYVVTYTGVMGQLQYNNFTFTEAGLYTNDNALVTRALITPGRKDNAHEFVFNWTLTTKPTS